MLLLSQNAFSRSYVVRLTLMLRRVCFLAMVHPYATGRVSSRRPYYPYPAEVGAYSIAAGSDSERTSTRTNSRPVHVNLPGSLGDRGGWRASSRDLASRSVAGAQSARPPGFRAWPSRRNPSEPSVAAT